MALQTGKRIRIKIIPPIGGPINLKVRWIRQEQTNWCWAACADMVLNKFSTPSVTQCDLANIAFGVAICCGNPQGCDRGLDDASITRLWRNKGFATAYRITTPLSCADLKGEINQQRPIELGFSWNTDKGHVMIAFGWGESANGMYIIVNDPNDYRRKAGAIYCKDLLSASQRGVWDATWFGLKR